MAKRYTDFSEYTTGESPADWTSRFVSGLALSVLSEASAEGGKVLRVSPPSSTGRRFVSWDAIDSLADRDDVEVLFKWRAPFGQSSAQLRAGLRGAGSAGNETLYPLGVDVVGGSGHRLQRYLNGSAGSISTSSFSVINNEWYITRSRVQGNSLYTKNWLASDPEPETWSIGPTTDSNISPAGWVGLFCFGTNSTTYDVDQFAVATGGETAEFSAVSTPVSFSGTVPALNGEEGAAFSESLAGFFSGTETPFSFSLQSGTLPAGLSLDGVTGVISGTPTAAGTASGLVVRATDQSAATADTNSFSIEIAPADEPPPVTRKLRSDDLIFDDRAGSTATNATGVTITALTTASTPVVAYHTTSGVIVDGVIEIEDAAFETTSESFELVVRKGDRSRVTTGTVVED